MQDSSGGGQLCVHQTEAGGDRAFAEQTLTGADRHRELPEAKRIDQIELEEGLDEISAAMNLNLAAFLRLEFQDLCVNFSLDQAG